MSFRPLEYGQGRNKFYEDDLLDGELAGSVTRLSKSYRSRQNELSGPGDVWEDIYEDENGNRYWASEMRRMNASGELSGIGSIFKKIGSGLKKVGKIALKVAPAVVGFIPGIGPKLQKAIDAGLETGNALLNSVGSGGSGASGGVAKGLAGITAYGNQVISALDAAMNANLDANGITQAEALVASLSDPSRVYQPKKGKDAEALKNFKSQAAQKLDALRARAAQPAQQPQQPPNQTAPGAQTTADDGFDTKTLLLIGAGLLLILRK